MMIGQAPGARVAAQQTGEIDAAHARQHPVEQDQVGQRVLHQLPAPFPHRSASTTLCRHDAG
jgi:hypothetical protein